MPSALFTPFAAQHFVCVCFTVMSEQTQKSTDTKGVSLPKQHKDDKINQILQDPSQLWVG